MDRNEVIKFLCALVSSVGTRVYHNELEHDCFCSESRTFETVHPEVLAFINNAVEDRIRRHKGARPSLSMSPYHLSFQGLASLNWTHYR